MLMEKRFQEILRILEEQGTVSVQDLTESLDASEATIRRDLSQLAQMGKLKKIYRQLSPALDRLRVHRLHDLHR